MSAQGGPSLNQSQYETFRCLSDFYRHSIPRWKITAPLTSMLRTSSSMDSSTSAAQIVVEYDGVDDGGGEGKSVEKSSKVEEPQRPEKSAKAIGSEEPSFLTSDTRLAFTKDGFQPYKTHDRELPTASTKFSSSPIIPPTVQRCKELELPLRVLTVFERFLRGPEALSIPLLLRLSTKPS